jgi:hypothetical protein
MLNKDGKIKKKKEHLGMFGKKLNTLLVYYVVNYYRFQNIRLDELWATIMCIILKLLQDPFILLIKAETSCRA